MNGVWQRVADRIRESLGQARRAVPHPKAKSSARTIWSGVDTLVGRKEHNRFNRHKRKDEAPLMGSSSHDANDDDLARAKRLLQTSDRIELPPRDERLTFPALVSELIKKNQTVRRNLLPPGLQASEAKETVDVFISYPRSSRDRIVAINNGLVAAGYSVFFDFETLRGGDEFSEVIDYQLKGARAVVACWSPTSFKSRWCQSEWRVALNHRNLVPIMIETFTFDDIPTEFNGIHYIDFTNFSGSPQELCFTSLLRSIAPFMSR
jgi:hypothetical protein